MGLIDGAVDIAELGQRNLWVLWGRSGSGKTHFASTFPKPMLYIQVGDDGSNTISDVEGVKAIRADTPGAVKTLLEEARLNKTYKTIVVDTFSLIVNDWVNENAIKKKKRMTQQMWGDMKTDQEELIKAAWILSATKCVVLTCHEASDGNIEGMEDEIIPDIRPSVSKGARTYLESMANYGIHTVVVSKEKEKEDGSTETITVHAAHLASNPYYWVKLQKPAHVKVPKTIINPSYAKIKKILTQPKGE